MTVRLDDIRPIPWAIGYSVTRSGIVLKTNGLEIIRHTTKQGYYQVSIPINRIKTKPRRVNQEGHFVNVDEKLIFKTFSVHRIVAEVWVDNPDPENFNVVNHIDGNTLNNSADNLEWCDHRTNVRHAIDNRLINTSVGCKVRSFKTGTVTEFNSIADAKRFMGLPINTLTSNLNPRRFGILLNGDFEFRFVDDDRPWFYEGRDKIVSGKYWFRTELEGKTVEAFNKEEFCRIFPDYRRYLSDISFKSIVAKFAKDNPDVDYTFRDASLEDNYGNSRAYQRKDRFRIWVYDIQDKVELHFDNTSLCGDFFGKNRRFISEMINKGRLLNNRYIIANANNHTHIEAIKLLYKDWGVNKPL